jgi:hypothetical protein
MSRTRHLSLASLFVLAAGPFAWVACGGSKPPETPADESTSSSGDTSSSSAPGDSSAPASSAASNDTPAPADTPATPPAPPPISGTDCGQCIDKTCGKQESACGKNPDCQGTIDSFHGCGSDKGASACVDAASMPSKAKPKKLAGAFATCAKKAATKACKSQCK